MASMTAAQRQAARHRMTKRWEAARVLAKALIIPDAAANAIYSHLQTTNDLTLVLQCDRVAMIRAMYWGWCGKDQWQKQVARDLGWNEWSPGRWVDHVVQMRIINSDPWALKQAKQPGAGVVETPIQPAVPASKMTERAANLQIMLWALRKVGDVTAARQAFEAAVAAVEG